MERPKFKEERIMFYTRAELNRELCEYTSVIERYIYKVARKRMYKMFKVMMSGD